MRICYYIQNHLAPPQACRLVAALRRSQPDSFVLIGHDGFAGHCTADELRRSVDADVFEFREPGRRGYFPVLQPYFDAVEWLSQRGIPYDWLVYLSAQDYPVRPLRDLEALLAAGGCDGFVRFWKACDSSDPASPWKSRRHQGTRRYYYQYFDAPRWTMPALRVLRSLNGVQSRVHFHLVYGPRVGLRLAEPPFGPGLVCYAGSLWTVLRRECAEHVADRVRCETALMEWYRRTVCPCESVVQTLLLNEGRFTVRNDDLRYTDFTGSRDGRPRTLSARDLPLITGGGYYFARKFDLGVDAAVLDRIDREILGVG